MENYCRKRYETASKCCTSASRESRETVTRQQSRTKEIFPMVIYKIMLRHLRPPAPGPRVHPWGSGQQPPCSSASLDLKYSKRRRVCVKIHTGLRFFSLLELLHVVPDALLERLRLQHKSMHIPTPPSQRNPWLTGLESWGTLKSEKKKVFSYLTPE